MNRKQKIIVSVTGIFLVALILVGLTYAYFLTQINGNSKSTSISVTTANLELEYGDGTTALLTSSTKLIPSSNPINTKDFTVTNTGDATEYAVMIENVRVKNATTGNLTTFDSNDFKYTLTCTKEDGTSCNGVSSQTTLPMSDAILVENDIAKGDIHTYVITLWYIETNKDQSKDMNKTLEARINIEDANRINPYSSNTNSLAYNIINNALNVNQEQINDGYAIYRSTPLTDMAIESSSKPVLGKKGTLISNTRIEDFQNKYFVYSDTVSVVKEEQYYFVLDNPKIIKYSEEYEQLKGKYIFTTMGFKTENEARTSSYATKANPYDIDPIKIVESASLNTFQYSALTIDTETLENSLSTSEDDYGISYYFRGQVKNNYVSFAGFTWRIIRINGDGSIRLILDGTLDKVKKDGVEVYKNEKLSSIDGDGIVEFNKNANDNAHVGYMYGNFTGNSTSYNEAHSNQVNSTIKTYIDAFYEQYLKSYERFLADTMFCGDKSLSSDYSSTNTGFGTNSVFYSSYERIVSGKKIPTLKCAENESNTFSRYTSKIDTSTETVKGVKVNNDLDYPIALLSIDESVFAGAKVYQYNTSYYLYDAYKDGLLYRNWWSMSPGNNNSMGTFGFKISPTYRSINFFVIDGDGFMNYASGVRPVINLKASSIVTGGNGTSESPYTIG